MAALESVLNGSTKSKASAKQPVKAVSELAQPPIMKLKKESVSQSQTLKENPKKTLSSAIDDQPKKKQKTIVDKEKAEAKKKAEEDAAAKKKVEEEDVIVIRDDDDGDAPAQVQLATIQRNADCVRTCHICAWNRPTPANPCHNCNGTGPVPVTSAPGTGPHRDNLEHATVRTRPAQHRTSHVAAILCHTVPCHIACRSRSVEQPRTHTRTLIGRRFVPGDLEDAGGGGAQEKRGG